MREDTQPFSLGNFDGLYFIHILNPEKVRKLCQKDRNSLYFHLCAGIEGKRQKREKTTKIQQETGSRVLLIKSKPDQDRKSRISQNKPHTSQSQQFMVKRLLVTSSQSQGTYL